MKRNVSERNTYKGDALGDERETMPKKGESAGMHRLNFCRFGDKSGVHGVSRDEGRMGATLKAICPSSITTWLAAVML